MTDDRKFDQVLAELRAPVPVDPAWRARLLRELSEAEMRPDLRMGSGGVPGRWRVRPVVAMAAAVAFLAVGLAGGVSLGRRAVKQSRAVSEGQVEQGGNIRPDLRPVRFVLVAPAASRVSVVGDFNRWNAAASPMQRAQDGRSWFVEVQLPPGRHVYAFVVDGDVMGDPSAAAAPDDGFGVPNSVMLVADGKT